MAVWYYMPSSISLNEDDKYYCDNCITRGCYCNAVINFDETTDNVEYNKDQFGRDLPCVEYDYCETGFNEDE